jgi:hypothetical protein
MLKASDVGTNSCGCATHAHTRVWKLGRVGYVDRRLRMGTVAHAWALVVLGFMGWLGSFLHSTC